MVFRDVGRFEFGQDCNLLDDVVHVVFSIFDIDDFDGDRLASSAINTEQISICQQEDICKCSEDSETSDGYRSPFVHSAEASTTFEISMLAITLADSQKETLQHLPMHVCLV